MNDRGDWSRAELRLFHVGLIVPEIESAQAQFTAMAGHRWTRTEERALHGMMRTGRRSVRLRFCYSTCEPVVELIQPLDSNDLWVATSAPLLHHLGYWTDDVIRDHDRLEALGLQCYYHGVSAEGRGVERGSYLKHEGDAFHLEIVDEAARPAFERLLAEGAA